MDGVRRFYIHTLNEHSLYQQPSRAAAIVAAIIWRDKQADIHTNAQKTKASPTMTLNTASTSPCTVVAISWCDYLLSRLLRSNMPAYLRYGLLRQISLLEFRASSDKKHMMTTWKRETTRLSFAPHGANRLVLSTPNTGHSDGNIPAFLRMTKTNQHQ